MWVPRMWGHKRPGKVLFILATEGTLILSPHMFAYVPNSEPTSEIETRTPIKPQTPLSLVLVSLAEDRSLEAEKGWKRYRPAKDSAPRTATTRRFRRHHACRSGLWEEVFFHLRGSPPPHPSPGIQEGPLRLRCLPPYPRATALPPCRPGQR